MREQTEREKHIVTFKEVETFVKEVTKICNQHKFSGIFAPPRGGLVFGVWLSNITGLPMLLHPQKECLIIDDIADTGETLKRYSGKCFIATMFYNKECSYVPNFWIYEKDNKWIVFPWEE